MLEFAATLEVKHPIADVFAWLTNATNQGKFDKGSVEMHLLTPEPWQTGSQFREVRNLGGRMVTVFSEIGELVPNQHFVIRSKTGPDWLGIWRFEPTANGTRLHWTGQLRMKGFARLFEPLIGRQMRATITQQFAALPALIEADLQPGG